MRALLRVGVPILVLVVSPLAAAGATAYSPITVTSPSRDVRSSSSGGEKTYDKPFLDLVRLHGEHYRRWISVVVTYQDLRPSTYTRHSLALTGPSSRQGDLIELRSGADPDTTKVTLYPLDNGADNEGGTINPIGCAEGVEATPSYRHNIITYALPLSCYGGVDEDSAAYGARAEKWSAATWQRGDVDTRHAPDLYDGTGGLWDWTSPPPS